MCCHDSALLPDATSLSFKSMRSQKQAGTSTQFAIRLLHTPEYGVVNNQPHCEDKV